MGKKKQTDKDKKAQESLAEKRKSDFFKRFRSEAPYIRDEIVRDLHSYNMLLSMEAESFEDIALRVIAKRRGIKYDPLNPPKPDCPDCGKHDKVGTKGSQGYHCRRCNKGFRATHNSIIFDQKISDLQFLRALTAILDGQSMTKTMQMCDIKSGTTYYRIRNKVFYALQLFLSEVSLFGVVQADCAFVRVSYKGLDLRESEFDEESMFFDETAFIPRGTRKRGRANPMAERNANSVCILSLIDEYGHTANLFCGTGLASLKTFQMYVPENKIRLVVPQKDPFLFLKKVEKKEKRKPETKPGSASLLVTDKELALVNYADYIGVKCESHVYRRNGVQVALPEGAHDIQKINSLHSRLKRFLLQHPVSSKYLPGYLTLFDFREMTACSKPAVERIMEILATPGWGKSPEFYQQMFSVPNYLEQWFAGDHPLKKLPYNQLLAFYLYDHIRNKNLYPGTQVTLGYINRVCGYSGKHARTSYQNLLNAGYRELILTYFGEVMKAKDVTVKPMKNVPPIIPLLHEEWAKWLRGDNGPRPTFKQFAIEKIEQHKLPYSAEKLSYWFRRAETLGICSPFPSKNEQVPAAPRIPQIDLVLHDEWTACIRGENGTPLSFARFHKEKMEQYGLKYSESTLKNRFLSIERIKLRAPAQQMCENNTPTYLPTERDISLYLAYNRLVEEQRMLGSAGMNNDEMSAAVGAEYNLSAGTVQNIVRKVRNYKIAHADADEDGANGLPVRSNQNRVERSKSEDGAMTLFQFNPAIAGKWHPTKNGTLTPDQVTYGSAKKVWWLCPDCGHEWEAEVRSQARKLKCPLCSRLTKGHSAGLVSDNQELSSQWHPTKNGALAPDHVTLGSIKKVWWLCEKGHEWEARIDARSGGSGCPYCGNRKVLPGYNDLATIKPELAAQWHPTKNGDLIPSQVPPQSRKKVWWRGVCGHEWEAAVANRYNGSNCPYCVRRGVTAKLQYLENQDEEE